MTDAPEDAPSAAERRMVQGRIYAALDWRDTDTAVLVCESLRGVNISWPRVNVGATEPPVPFVFWATRMVFHDRRFARLLRCALAHGADPSEGGPQYDSALAAVKGMFGGALRELLAAGAPAGGGTVDDSTPLHAAVCVGQFIAFLARRLFTTSRAELSDVLDGVMEFAHTAPEPLARAGTAAERALFAEFDGLALRGAVAQRSVAEVVNVAATAAFVMPLLAAGAPPAQVRSCRVMSRALHIRIFSL